MSVTIQADDFDTPGSLPSPWAVATGGTWTVVSGRVRVDGTPNTYRRAVLTGSSPWPMVTGAATQPSPKRIEIEARVTIPAAFSATQDSIAGVSFWANGANSTLSMVEGFYTYRPSLAAHQVKADIRLAGGSVQGLFPFVSSNIPTPSVGSTHKLAMRISYFDPIIAIVRLLWDDVDVGGAQFQLYPSLGFGATPAIGSFYAAMIASAPGPADASGNPVNPIYFDTFRVRDWGAAAQFDDLFPEPTAAAFPTITHTTVADEIDDSGLTLSIPPQYVITYEDDLPRVSTEFDGGYLETTSRTTRARRRWGWRWEALDSTDRATLVTLFDTAHSRAKTITWSEPDTGAALTVRVTSGSLSTRREGMDVFSVAFDVEEAHA